MNAMPSWHRVLRATALWLGTAGAASIAGMPEDGPFVQPGGTIWYRDGIVHRDEGPAVERVDGSREWLAEGICNCEIGPL